MNHTTSHPELRSLELVNSRLALESMALESFADTVRKIIPSLASSIKAFTTNFRYVLSDDKGATNFSYNDRDFENLVKMLEGHKYTNLMDLRMYVPEGFKGNITAYAATLQRAQVHVAKVIGDVVVPYNVFLSKLVTNPNAAKDTKLQLSALNQIKQAREFLKGQLGEYFQAGSTASYCKLGDAVESNNDWKLLFAALNGINTDFDIKRAEQVKNAVDDCSQLLDALSTAAQENGLREISPQTLRTLGDATLEVAREIEFFSLVNYQVSVLLTVMGQNTAFLKKALK